MNLDIIFDHSPNDSLHFFLINSLAPGRSGSDFTSVFFKHILHIDILCTFCEIVCRRVSQNPFANKTMLVQVMARCCQATSHYLSQCWPSSISPHDVTRPHWVKHVLSMHIYDCWYISYISNHLHSLTIQLCTFFVFILICCGQIMVDFTHILQGYLPEMG